MKTRIAEFVAGAILAQGVGLGVALGLVWTIPIRGTLLAVVVLPISCGVMWFCTALAGMWALRS